jgi:predicted NBD/HSP70 family sugar kinase
MKKLAFDIGGTNIRMAEVREVGIGSVAHLHTPALPEVAMEELIALARTVSPDGVSAVVCGVPAIVSDAGTIVSATNLPEWGGYEFKVELEKQLHATVQVVNDAELAALGEARYGAGAGARTVAYLGLGTGIGTACVVEGVVEPHSSDTDSRDTIITLSSGETLEAQAGGRALTERYGAAPETLPRRVWDELTPDVAHAVMTMITLWSPDVIVLGGSLMNEENGFQLDEVIRAVSGSKNAPENLPDIRKAKFGEASALHGARALMPE